MEKDYNSDGNSSRRRRRRDEIEEGEVVYSWSDTDDDDNRYVFKARGGGDDVDDGADGPEIKRRRRLEDRAPASPTSSETISEVNSGAAADLMQLVEFFPCPICRRVFESKKAMHGHMKIHQQEEERPICGVGDNKEEVVAEPVLDPIPLAYAIPVDDTRNATDQHLDQPAVVEEERPKPASASQEEAWCCKVEGCNKRYATHQALGGHMAGHKNKEIAAAESSGSNTKPAKEFKCKVCGDVRASGVALGGHMRKHFEGPLGGQKRRCAAADVELMPVQESLAPVTAETTDLVLTLSLRHGPATEAASPAVESASTMAEVAQPAPEIPELALTMALPATEVAQPTVAMPETSELALTPATSVNETVEPVTTPAVPGVIRIFGVNIVLHAPSGEEIVTHAEADS